MHSKIPEERRMIIAKDAVQTLSGLAGVPEERTEWLGKLSTDVGTAPRSTDVVVTAAHLQEQVSALIDVAAAQQERIETLEAQLKKGAKK
jgi:predicted ATP-grasp superfamily ATP-dependent carboligase